jgi:hypothetical protein
MENLCYFVNSRGILKSCNFHSKNPKSSCNNDSGYLFEMLTNMFDGMSIYVCSDLLNFFVNNILHKINKMFVLVSGDSDLCVPVEALKANEIGKLLNSPYLIKWFLQNTQVQYNPKMIRFTAAKERKKNDSRVRLYNSMVRRFAGQHGYRLKDQSEDQFVQLYVLVKQ